MRIALVAVFTLLLAAPAAQAKVRWPSERAYAPGDRISVSVTGERKVDVSILRVTATGKVMSAVTRRTLRRGTVSATLARAGRYAVRVDRRQRTVDVVAPATPVSAPPAMAPAQPGPAPCQPGVLELRLDAPRAPRGGALPYSIVNNTPSCAYVGLGSWAEVAQPDGTWQSVPWPTRPVALVALALPSGEFFRKTLEIPADATPGTYRLLDSAVPGSQPVFEIT